MSTFEVEREHERLYWLQRACNVRLTARCLFGDDARAEAVAESDRWLELVVADLELSPEAANDLRVAVQVYATGPTAHTWQRIRALTTKETR